MRLWDWLTSTKRPDAGVAVCPAGDVRSRLLALNRETAPFRIVDGAAEQVDLVAEWKMVDAQWYEVFAKAGLTKIFRILLKFDDGNRTVRTSDREYEVAWEAGVPTLSLAASASRGQTRSFQFGTRYGFTETLAPGSIYKYTFNTNDLKNPIQEAVTGCGWTYKGVAFGKL